MEKREIRPNATPKPLNRSSPEVAYVIRSWISTHVQNLVTIPQGVSFPCMCEVAHQNVYSATFFPCSSNVLQPRPLNRFSRIISQTTRFRARMCLFGVRKQKFNIYTLLFPKNRHFRARYPILMGLRKFSTKNRFTVGCFHVNSP